jgi:hypothetical protein
VDIKIDLKETVYENADWINFAQYPVVGACEHWFHKRQEMLTS